MEKYVKFEPFIETVSGRKFHFLAPHPNEIDITDIAHALSNICRFTGHTKRYYSVAQHSVHVASLLPPDLRLAGLLHDASEAYIADVASPVKPYLDSYQEFERCIMEAIADKFNLPNGFHRLDAVVTADLKMLKKEAQEFMPSRGEDWLSKVHGVEAPDIYLPVMSPERAKGEFLLAYHLLTETVCP